MNLSDMGVNEKYGFLIVHKRKTYVIEIFQTERQGTLNAHPCQKQNEKISQTTKNINEVKYLIICQSVWNNMATICCIMPKPCRP